MPNQNVDDLVAEVAEDVTVMDSAATLITGIATILADVQAQLAAQSIDNATLNQLKSDLDSHGQALATAVAANTPAG